jgi:hypothetical protein
MKPDGMLRKSAPMAGSAKSKSKSEVVNVRLKSRMRLASCVNIEVVDTFPSTTGHAYSDPTVTGFVAGEPFTVAKRALEVGLNLMSEVVKNGPTGGVV